MREVPVGMYLPGCSPLHRLDGRVKLVAFVVLLAAVIATETVAGYGVMVLVTAGLMVLSRIPAAVCLSSVRRLWLFFVTIFLMNLCFFEAESAWVRWWIFQPSAAGALQGMHVVLRVLLALVLSNILTCTTPPMDMTAALESLMSPLRFVGVPTRQVAMILSVAIGFIPTLFEETAMIQKAQTARGARFDSPKLLEKAGAVAPLVVPIFLAAFKRADELAMAMEARGYRTDRGGRGRRKKPVPKMDWLVLPAVAAVLAVQMIFF